MFKLNDQIKKRNVIKSYIKQDHKTIQILEILIVILFSSKIVKIVDIFIYIIFNTNLFVVLSCNA